MMKKHKAGKLDVHTMEPRSCMIYIHYTLPKHKEKKTQMQLPTHIQTNSEISIHLQTFFSVPTTYQVLETEN